MKHKVGDVIGWTRKSINPPAVGKICKITEAGNYIITSSNGLNRERVAPWSVVVNFTDVFDELVAL